MKRSDDTPAIAAALHRPEAGPPRVVIVGAGFAGLAATRELRDSRSEVTVIDDRARLATGVSTTFIVNRLVTSHPTGQP